MIQIHPPNTLDLISTIKLQEYPRSLYKMYFYILLISTSTIPYISSSVYLIFITFNKTSQQEETSFLKSLISIFSKMESNYNNEEKNTQKELKHLGFVRVATINTIMLLSSVYDFAKQNSGPLRSAVDSVEGAVTTVVTPVLDKFKDFPDSLLAFLDKKVDVASAKFDEHAPPLAKQVATKVHFVFDQTTQLAKEVIHHAQVGGPLAAAQYAADESKELVLKQSVKAWSKLDQFQPFHMVAEIIIPTATHWSEKYNNVITSLRENGHAVFSYVPLVPLDEISKAFKQSEGANEGDVPNSSNDEVVVSQ